MSRTSMLAVTIVVGACTRLTATSNAAARDATSGGTTVNNAAFDKLRPVADMESERATEPQEHLQRAGDVVELVPEIEAHVAEAEAEADAVQRSAIRGGREQRIWFAHPCGVEEPDHVEPIAPAEAVFQVRERKGGADRFLELVSMHRTDAADGELSLWRQRSAGPSNDPARAERLMRRQQRARPGGDDVARKVEVAAERIRRRDLGRPVEPEDRLRTARAIEAPEPLAEWVLELVAPVRGVERFVVEVVAAVRRADDERIQMAVDRRAIRSKRLGAVPHPEIGLHLAP